jgi:RHS repeat-associated protein/uncharacterized repeat protein (TIGR01451 family)
MRHLLSTLLGLFSATALLATDLSVSFGWELQGTPLFVGEKTLLVINAENTSTAGGGPLDSPNTILTVVLPETVRGTATSTQQGTVSKNGNQYIFNLGLLAKNTVVRTTIELEGVTPTALTTVTATIVGQFSDPDESNNNEEFFFGVAASPEADLNVVKKAPEKAPYGEPLTYEILVNNNGPDPATSVVVIDTLPLTVERGGLPVEAINAGSLSIKTSKGTFDRQGKLLQFNIGPMAVNELVTITVVVDPVIEDTLENSVTVVSSPNDPNSDNNKSEVETVIKPRSWFYGGGGVSSDPVATATGEFIFQTQPLLHLKGPMDLFFSVNYASFRSIREGVESALGGNWRHNFEYGIGLDASGDYLVVTPRGDVARFRELDGAHVLISPENSFYQLAENEGDFFFYDTLTETVVEFDETGAMVAWHDTFGMRLDFTWGEFGITSVQDAFGRELLFEYGSIDGLLSAVRSGDRSVIFLYDGPTQQLYSIEDAGGTVTSYFYEEHPDYGPLITDIRNGDAGLILLTNTYDAQGRVIEQKDGEGLTTGFVYDDSEDGSTTTTITDASGGQHIHVHDADDRWVSARRGTNEATTISYGANGLPVATANPDGTGAFISREPVSGHIDSLILEDSNELAVLYGERLFNGIRIPQIDQITYPDGTVESFTYSANGRPLTRVDRAGQTWGFNYDAFGLLMSQSLPAGGTEVRFYDADLNLAVLALPGEGFREFTYDAYGNRLSRTESDGTVTLYTYDGMNRRLSEACGDRLMTMTYGERGELLEINDNGAVTEFAYDNNYLLVSYVDPSGNQVGLGNVAGGNAAVIFPSPESGHLRTFDSQDQVVEVIDYADQVTRFFYDGRGRLVLKENPDGRNFATAYSPNGFPESQLGPWGTINLSHDPLGRLTGFMDPSGLVTTFSYNDLGSITGIEVGGTLTTQLEYNEANQLTAIVDSAGGRWEMDRTSTGRISAERDPLGNERIYFYSQRGWLEDILLPTSELLTFSYNSHGDLTGIEGDDDFSISYTVDDFGRVVRSEQLNLLYDPSGDLFLCNGMIADWNERRQLSQIEYAGGETIDYVYDDLGRVASVVFTREEVTANASFTYDEMGRRTGISRSNGVETTYSYDEAGWLSNIIERTADFILFDLQLTRDLRGDLVSAVRYQPLNYTLAEDVSTFAYNVMNQVVGYTYDAQGRRTADDVYTYTYDPLSRLTSIQGNGDVQVFSYDGFGSLVGMQPAGAFPYKLEWNYFLGLPSVGAVTQAEDPAGATPDIYVYTPDGELLFRVLADDTVHFYHFDEVGNTLLLTDNIGAEVAAYTYTPYGLVGTDAPGVENLFTFGGQVGVLQLTDSHFLMRQRVYDNHSRQFLTLDPLRQIDPLKANRYSFVAGNPLRYIDPTGLNPRVKDTDMGSTLSTGSSIVSTVSFLLEGLATGFQHKPHYPSGSSGNLIDGIADRASKTQRRVGKLRAKALDHLDARRMLRFFDRGKELSEVAQKARDVGAKSNAAGNLATSLGVGIELLDTFFDVSDTTIRGDREAAYAHYSHDRAMRNLTQAIKEGKLETRTAIRRQGQITRLLEDKLDGYEDSVEADVFYEVGDGFISSLRAMVPFPLPF